MPNTYAQHVPNKRQTPQTQPIPGRESEMKTNHAGGASFVLTIWDRLVRFLILGSEGNTYYATEQKMTLDNLDGLKACIKADGVRTVGQIVAIDAGNRAPKMSTILFALAVCHVHGDDATKAAVRVAIPKVIRIGTHLFMYLDNLKALGSMLSRSKRTALSALLNGWKPADLAYQMAKYQNREGWTWRDALRVIHPKPKGVYQRALFRLAIKGDVKELTAAQVKALPSVTKAVLKIKESAAKSVKLAEMTKGVKPVARCGGKTTLLKGVMSESALCKLIEKERLSHEMIPSELQTPAVIEALTKHMPATALLRQLARLGSKGLLDPLSDSAKRIAERLSDAEWLRKSRVHPIQVLSALTVYRGGVGIRGSLTWTPNPLIVNRLEKAFYAAFHNVEPTGKRFLVGLDVSGSMGTGEIAGVPRLTPCMGAACMSMVLARTEGDENVFIHGFSGGYSHDWYQSPRDPIGGFKSLGITSLDTLASAMAKAHDNNFGRTDCSIPMRYAMENRINVDVFVVITDNESYAGPIHPSQALNEYRRKFNPDARLVVIGMTATEFTVADPNDKGSLNVAGFDSAAPAIIAEFVRG